MHFRHADAVYGKSVQQKIDESIAPLIKSYYPKLNIEPSRCEPIIEISQGTMGTCTLAVNGVRLDIRVASAGPPDNFKVDFGGAFFYDMSAVERIIETGLSQDYGITAGARCGDPRERLLKPQTNFACDVVGSPVVHSMRLRTTSTGQVFVYKVPGLKRTSPIPDSVLALHNSGKRVVVPGVDVETFIRQGITSVMSQAQSYTVKCPAQMDLADKKHGVCSLTVPGLQTPERIGVWIDDVKGLSFRNIDSIIDRKKVEKMAQEDLNRRLSDNGDAPYAVVEFEKGLIVIEPPGTFDCKSTSGGKRYRLEVMVKNTQGEVVWRGIPLDATP